MTRDSTQKDLVILVADKNMEFAVKGLLSRHISLEFRKVVQDIYVHPHSDPGCLLHGHDFLRQFVNQYSHALIMLDRDGCGKENQSREELETEIETCLSKSGWEDRAAAVVIDPELEIWVWSDSPHVATVLGWTGKQPGLRDWLQSEGYQPDDAAKPDRPKKAVETALRISRKSRSSAIYRQLAEEVSMRRCIDPAFTKFKTTLRKWFGDC